MSDKPAILVETTPNAVVVRLQVRDLDETHITQMRNEMGPIVEASPATPFVIDMTPVKFVPSLTLGILVKMATEFKGRKQRLILVSLQSTVRQVFAITRLDKLFEIQDNVENAVKALTGPA